MDRREFFLLASSTCALAVAGCTDSSDDNGDADGENGDDGTEPDSTGDDTGSEGGEQNETDDDGTSDSEDGSEDDGADGDTDDEDDTDGDSTDGEDSDDGEGTDEATFGETFNWSDSFVAEATIETPEMGTTTMTIRSAGQNYYQTFETQQGTFEIYGIDGDLYLVQGDQCFKNPGDAAPDPDIGVDPQSEPDAVGSRPELTPEGRETIDGEEVYVYVDEADGQQTRMYVSVETGRLRRIEFEGGTIDYHSWGSVEPIEPPDLDCQEYSG